MNFHKIEAFLDMPPQRPQRPFLSATSGKSRSSWNCKFPSSLASRSALWVFYHPPHLEHQCLSAALPSSPSSPGAAGAPSGSSSLLRWINTLIFNCFLYISKFIMFSITLCILVKSYAYLPPRLLSQVQIPAPLDVPLVLQINKVQTSFIITHQPPLLIPKLFHLCLILPWGYCLHLRPRDYQSLWVLPGSSFSQLQHWKSLNREYLCTEEFLDLKWWQRHGKH